METPVNPVEVKAEAAPTPPQEATPSAPLTRFRAVVSGSGKRGNNAVFTTAHLKGLVEVAATFSDKITFFVDADSVKVRVLDSAKIALLDVMLPKSVFTDFAADGEGDIVVDAKSLLTILRRAKNRKVELKYEDGALAVTIAGVRSFRVKVLDNSTEEVPQPKVNHATVAYVDAETLREAVLDARVIKADAAKLVVENNTLTFKASNETKEVEVRLSDATGTAMSKYSLDYLVKALKAFSNGVVEVKFGNNAPLELSTTFNDGYIRVFVAPRVE
jgi:DNA polymerase III sliding clamp (beta) subunit (PCNA family)